MSFFNRAALVCAVLAVVVRVLAGLQGLAQNPLLTSRQLDSFYYVEWAREIAAGDWTGAHGIVNNGVYHIAVDPRGAVPYILNPLYAFVLAPIVGLFQRPGMSLDEIAAFDVSDARISLAVLLFQAALAGATTALTVVAARRFFGNLAAWTAGLAVALSTALVHLDAHVAVTGLAAFLVAGAVFASAPAKEGASPRGHGAVAAGLWLGIGALARPITQFALPFFAWRQWKDGGWKKAATVVLVFAACALPSFLRNWIVAHDAVVYTSASGLNLHIGNNAESRRVRTMTSALVQFEPIKMNYDAYVYVKQTAGLDHDPKPSEVSDYFRNKAIGEIWSYPGASMLFYANKARWFFSPVEVPSSASLATDLRFAPLLHLAFVPTWLVAAAGLVGAILFLRRRDVVCGPTSLLLAHLLVLTAVFPISHYRAPAIPAMAVLAGGAVAWVVASWRSTTKIALALVGFAIVVIAGWIDPQPDPIAEMNSLLLAMAAKDARRWDEAIVYVEEARAARKASHPGEPEVAMPETLLGEIWRERGDSEKAIEHLKKAVALDPHNPTPWLYLSKTAQEKAPPDLQLAESAARHVTEEYPLLWQGWERLLGVLVDQPSRQREAFDIYQKILELGGTVDESLRRKLGIK